MRPNTTLQLAHITWSQADQHPSAFKLCKALRELESPIYVTDGMAKTWFKVYYGDCTSFFSAGKLELKFGEQIRVQHMGAPMTAESMMLWLRKTHKVWDVWLQGISMILDIWGRSGCNWIKSVCEQVFFNVPTWYMNPRLPFIYLLDELYHTTIITAIVRYRCSTKWRIQSCSTSGGPTGWGEQSRLNMS